MVSTYQSGFRSIPRTTATALFETTNNWTYNIDLGSVKGVVFLVDLKKSVRYS